MQSFQRRTEGEFQFTVGQTVFWSITGFSLSYHRARSVWDIEWFLRNFIQFRFN